MKIHHCEQRSDEWNELRQGRITASVASKLVTPTGKPSTQWKGEVGKIIAEGRGLQEPEFIKPTYWMERGVDLEPEARGAFQVMTGLVVHECGFISESDHVGFSPDGYIRDEELSVLIPVELKCPKPSTHISWLIDGTVPKEHIAQCHFGLVVTGAPYMYWASYSPLLDPLIIKVEKNEYTAVMENGIRSFENELQKAKERFNG